MDLYNSSPAARAVWDGADAHLLAVYGFSIVEIAKDNPKEKTPLWRHQKSSNPPTIHGYNLRHHGQGQQRQDTPALWRY